MKSWVVRDGMVWWGLRRGRLPFSLKGLVVSQKEVSTDRQTDRQTERQIERQTYRKTDRQTNRTTDRTTERQKDGHSHLKRSFASKNC